MSGIYTKFKMKLEKCLLGGGMEKFSTIDELKWFLSNAYKKTYKS